MNCLSVKCRLKSVKREFESNVAMLQYVFIDDPKAKSNGVKV